MARNKARVATRNMAMSRQKKLDKMDVIELAKEKPKPEFHFRTARTSGRFVVTAKELVIGYEEPLSRPLTFAIERGEKIVLTGANGIGKTTLLKSILGLIPSLGGDVELGDYLEIGYCYSGKGEMYFGEEGVPYRADTVVVIPRNYPHRTQGIRGQIQNGNICMWTVKNF